MAAGIKPPVGGPQAPVNRADQSASFLTQGIDAGAAQSMYTALIALKTLLSDDLPNAMKNFSPILNQIQKDADATAQAIENTAARATRDISKSADQYQASQLSHWKSFRQSMENIILLHGDKTKKMMRNMSDEQRRLYQNQLQQMANDTTKRTDALAKQVYNILFRTSYNDTKRAFQMQFDQFYDFMDKKWRFQQKTAYVIMEKSLEGIRKFIGKTVGIVSDILSTIWDGLKKVGEFIKFDIFKALGDGLRKVSSILKALPGAEQALSSLKQVREVMADITRRFGVNGPESNRLLEGLYRISNQYITLTQNATAMRAVMAAGFRGDVVTAITADVARISQAYGVAEEQAASTMAAMQRTLGWTQGQGTQFYAAADFYLNRMGQVSGVASNINDLNALLMNSTDTIAGLQLALDNPESARNFQGFLLSTSQLATQAGANMGNLWNTILQGASYTNPTALAQAVGGPEVFLSALQSGDSQEAWRAITERMRPLLREAMSAGTEEERAAILQGLSKSLDTDMAMWYRVIQQYDAMGAEAWNTADAFYAVGDGVDYTTQQVQESLTPAQLLSNQLESFANSITIGNTPLPVLLEGLELLGGRLDVLSQGFGMVTQGIDFMFGPLGGVFTPIASLVTAVMAIGGILTDFSPEEMESFGVLGSLFQFGKDTVEQYGDQIKTWLSSMWDGILRFFDGTQGPSPFQRLIQSGVDWIQANVPWLLTQAETIVGEIANVLTIAFDQLTDPSNELVTTMGDTFGRILSTLADIVVITVDAVAPILVKMLDMLIEAFDRPEVKAGVSNLMGALGGALGQVGDQLAVVFNELVPLLVDAVRTTFAAVRLSLPDSALTDAVLGTKDTAVQTLIAGGLESLIPESERGREDAAYAALAYREGLGRTHHSEAFGLHNTWAGWSDQMLNAVGLGPNGMEGNWVQAGNGLWIDIGEASSAREFYEQEMAERDRMYSNILSPSASTVSPSSGSRTVGIGGVDETTQMLRDFNRIPTTSGGSGLSPLSLNYSDNPAVGLPGYGTARHNASGIHNGIDLDALRGTPVLALEDSVVVTANLGGETTGGGNELFLQSLSDPNRYFTFMHLDTLSVGTGDRVTAGDILGTVGTSGNAPEDDPMLHFGVSFGDADSGYVDPLSVYSEAQLAQLLGSSSEVPLAPPQEAGGIILDEVLAPLGEAGPEVVLPLPTMEQIAAKQDVARNEMISVVREEVRRLVDAIFTVKDSVEGLKESDMGVLLGRDR